MDGTGEHYAKWNKPGGERQIPYDLPYKGKLVNKTKKQVKYNTKHWNKEETESNQKGGLVGILGGKGQDFWGTYIKDTWRKPNWVGSRGWVPIAGLGELMGGKWSQLYLNNKKMWKENVLLLFLGYWVRGIGHAEDRYSPFQRFSMFSLKAKIAGSLLGQGTCLASGPGPWLGTWSGNTLMFLYFNVFLYLRIVLYSFPFSVGLFYFFNCNDGFISVVFYATYLYK